MTIISEGSRIASPVKYYRTRAMYIYMVRESVIKRVYSRRSESEPGKSASIRSFPYVTKYPLVLIVLPR